jgi:hypothetical protein
MSKRLRRRRRRNKLAKAAAQTPRPLSDGDRLKAIRIHFQPLPNPVLGSIKPELRGMAIGLMPTPPGQTRDKHRFAYQAQRDWEHNLSFVAALDALIPSDSPVLKAKAEKLLLNLFGEGFSTDTLARFNTGERQRIRKCGTAAWSLVKKIRRHCRFPK